MLSVLSDRLIPEFIRENHPTFEVFLKAWLDYLDDSTNGPRQHIAKLSEYVTPDDKTYIDSIKSAYMTSYPNLPLGNVVATDDAFLIKNLREIYRQKGSEAAYRFFFQAQFGVDISFNYPKENILRLSDGKWHVYKYINFNFGEWTFQTDDGSTLITENGDVIWGGTEDGIPAVFKLFFNKQIRGRTSKATAFVNVLEGADPTYWIEKGELPLKEVSGDFIPGEIVEVVE